MQKITNNCDIKREFNNYERAKELIIHKEDNYCNYCDV